MKRSLGVACLALLTALMLAPAAAYATNDEYWGQQWALEKVRAQAAWGSAGGPIVTVAIVDTGVDLKHPDLAGRLLPGKDFVDGDDDPQDLNGHGTHMAGTVGAINGNAVGIAAVANRARILPVRVLDSKGQSDDPEAVADGIRWAADHGAKVINLSLAQDGPPGALGEIPGDLLSHSAIDEAIRYVTSRGAVAVVASGNSDGGGKPETSYSASTPGAIVVGASTRTDQRAAYSNYGSGLDVLAPGGGSATQPDFAQGCTEDNAIVGLYWDPKTSKPDYAGACGSSVAVSHVSGVAAMLVARGYTNAQAVERIKRTAIDLGPKGKDAHTGWGRLDAARALGAPSRANPTSPAASVSPPPPAKQGRVKPAADTVPTAKTPSQEPSLPPQALRTLAEEPDRSAPIAIAALLALAMGLAHSEIRRRT